MTIEHLPSLAVGPALGEAVADPPGFSWLELPLPPTRIAEEVLRGLARRPRELPFWLFYDETGCRLFEAICATPEYYLRRAEAAILAGQMADMAAVIGPVGAIIEPGAGDCSKIDPLIRTLRPAVYMPVDLAGATLRRSAMAVAGRHAGLRVQAVRADFVHQAAALPALAAVDGQCLVFYPGASIGNFDPPALVGVLQSFGQLAGSNGGLLVGVDARKAPARLHAAYNDAEGLTARFNRNLLMHINAMLDAGFDPHGFDHYAYYDPVAGRVEMHLVCRQTQRVRVAGQSVEIATGETVHTENAYKYRAEDFDALAAQAGWRFVAFWDDLAGDFWLRYYRRGA